ncbi:MAG: sortase [Faecousia sp.]
MRNKLGTICMVLGAVLILAALSLFFTNRREADQAEAAVEQILPRVMQSIRERPAETLPAGETEPSNEAEPVYPDPYDPTMTEVEIDGYAYIGYLSIPALDLRLPVMSQWDYTRLKISPCRYSGSSKTHDLVIAAHNYTGHFGTLSHLSVGDAVYFVDMDNVLSRYEVVAMETLSPTDVAEMTAGEYDLTLFTCTYGGRSRVTVRCMRSEGTDIG